MRISRRSTIDVSLLVLVNALWAVQYPAYKVVSERMGPLTASAWIFLVATLVLLPFLFRERTRHADPGADRDSGGHSFLDRRNLVGFIFIGVIGLVPASALLAWGERRSTASNASLIYLTVPIITAIMASIILKEKMTWVRWVSLLISISGVLILSEGQAKWKERVEPHKSATVLVRPVTMKQLYRALDEVMDAGADEDDEQE